MLNFANVNVWAIVVSAVVYMAIGAIWYSPVLYSRQWRELQGKKPGGINPSPSIYLVNLVVYLIVALILARVVFYFGATTILSGAFVGLLMWVGFAGAASFIENLFSQKSWKLYAINYGYHLVALVVIGAILGIWR